MKIPKYFSIQRNNRIITYGNTVGETVERLETLAGYYPGGELRFHDESPKPRAYEIGPIFGMTWEQIQAKQQGQGQ